MQTGRIDRRLLAVGVMLAALAVVMLWINEPRTGLLIQNTLLLRVGAGLIASAPGGGAA